MKVRSRAVSVIDGAPHIPGAIFKRPATKGPGHAALGAVLRVNTSVGCGCLRPPQHLDRYEPSPIGRYSLSRSGSCGQ